MFQSAPGFSAGRNPSSGFCSAAPPCFNPLPAFRPGETTPTYVAGTDYELVSIRSRLFGREKLQAWCPATRQRLFQSAPGFSAGRNVAIACIDVAMSTVSIRSRLFGREKQVHHRTRRFLFRCFNPLPAFRPGETAGFTTVFAVVRCVSIRSRLFGREKRA